MSPAKSQAQQKAMAMALAAERGEIPVTQLKGAAREMYNDMSAKTIEEFARTPRKGLPRHVAKKKVKPR